MEDLDGEAERAESSAGMELVALQDSAALEPYVGMEFESEDTAKEFYDKYAQRVGFVMRIDRCRRSEVDRRILSRRFSCNKQGFYVKIKDAFRPVRKTRRTTREGCNAMMLVKVDNSGKWVVTRFEKDHTHPLVISGCPSRNSLDNKDRRIQLLTKELERQDRLCNLYRDQLLTFLKIVEGQTEQLSTKIDVIVNNVRDFEAEMKKKAFTPLMALAHG